MNAINYGKKFHMLNSKNNPSKPNLDHIENTEILTAAYIAKHNPEILLLVAQTEKETKNVALVFLIILSIVFGYFILSSFSPSIFQYMYATLLFSLVLIAHRIVVRSHLSERALSMLFLSLTGKCSCDTDKANSTCNTNTTNIKSNNENRD